MRQSCFIVPGAASAAPAFAPGVAVRATMETNMLGLTVKDRITGFSGVVTGYVEYLTGCNQVLLSPPMRDGKRMDGEWFDVQRVEDTGVERIVLDNGLTPGCDRAAPKR